MILTNKYIEHAHYKLHESDYYINTATMSNDSLFIVSGGSDNY